MRLGGGWPDGPQIWLYISHVLYIVAELFEQFSIH